MAGVFLAADLILWHQAIADVGAGLSTVLGNLQVVVVPFVAWAVLREAPGRRILAALPLSLLGIVLISGVLEAGAYGANPARGVLFGMLTGLAYAGFILVLRHGNEDTRRPAGPLFDATWVAGLVALAVALALGVDDLVPAWPSAGWLMTLALTSQVLGWLLISTSLPRLPGGAHLDDPDRPARRLRGARHRAAGRGAERAAAVRRGADPGGPRVRGGAAAGCFS